MATPSQLDVLLDDVQLAREDTMGDVLESQHALHNAMTALRAAWDTLAKVEGALAGDDERGQPGVIFRKLAEIRESPAVRRGSWDGQTERRGDGAAVVAL